MATREASPVTEYAEAICSYLNLQVLPVENLDALTLLDVLASSGLTLVEDTKGEASTAYFQLLAEWGESDSEPPGVS